jgi:hypothetical protein
MKPIQEYSVILFFVALLFGCGEPEDPDFRPRGGATPEDSQNWPTSTYR